MSKLKIHISVLRKIVKLFTIFHWKIDGGVGDHMQCYEENTQDIYDKTDVTPLRKKPSNFNFFLQILTYDKLFHRMQVYFRLD